MTIEKLNKVAKINLIFWLMKIVATTLGETLGDFISMTLNLGYTVGIAITFAFFFAVLLTQLAVKNYVPVIYWLVIIGTTTLGTEISDYIDRTLHLGYTTGSILLAGGLLLTLFLWFFRYKNLEVYPIVDRQKEFYYWVAILFSNSLGTAFGDFLGEYFELSYSRGCFCDSRSNSYCFDFCIISPKLITLFCFGLHSFSHDHLAQHSATS